MRSSLLAVITTLSVAAWGCGSDRGAPSTSAGVPRTAPPAAEAGTPTEPATAATTTTAAAEPPAPTPEQPAPIAATPATDALSFTDGTSHYRLAKDHRFTLTPVGLSGRMIEGWWIFSDAKRTTVRVVGVWSWVNGSSLADDYRSFELELTGERASGHEQARKLSKADYEAAVARCQAAEPAVPERP